MKSTAVVVSACPWDRSRLKTIVEKGNFKILGEASRIEQAVEFVNKFSDMQFIFSDLELRGGDGLELASTLINHRQINIAIISRLLRHSSDVLLKELAAVGVRLVSPMPTTEREIEELVQAILEAKNINHNSASTRVIPPKTSRLKIGKLRHRIDGEVLIIGGSTGALNVLYQLLRAIEINDEQAVVICLHTIRSYRIVKKMERLMKRNVITVSDAEKFELGNVYVLKSGRNYKLVVKGGELFLKGFRERLGLGYRPSINLIMENLSAAFGKRCTGIVLSGYGNDGVLGSRLIAMRGGKVLVQDPETADIPIMPRLVKEMMNSLGKAYKIIRLRP